MSCPPEWAASRLATGGTPSTERRLQEYRSAPGDGASLPIGDLMDYLGVDHVGIGVHDMDIAVEFFSKRLGFTDTVFDVSVELPEMQAVTRRKQTVARTVMLRHECVTPLGPGKVKLVQLLNREVAPIPVGQAWGEVGICEVCLHSRDVEANHRRLVQELDCVSLMEPLSAHLPPDEVTCDLSYIADSSGGKIELIEWTGLRKARPGPARLEGVNHVAFGVADIDRSREFYAQFGFTESLFDYDGYFDPMAPWFQDPPPQQHLTLIMPTEGAGIEPVQHAPASVDCRGEWGHSGPMEFAIATSNLAAAYDALSASGIEFLCDPQSIAVDDGAYSYAYFVDPDGLYVSLVEGP